jgi:hypothetical protein
MIRRRYVKDVSPKMIPREARLEVIGTKGRSVNGQDLAGTGAATRATEGGAIATGSLHGHCETSRSNNHRGRNVGRELGTADLRCGEGVAIEEHDRG